MSARVTWKGLQELFRDLQLLPAQSASEATNIATAAANSAAVEVRTVYGDHAVTGVLQARVRVDDLTTKRFGVHKRVINTAPHAHLFEFGTVERKTDAGWSRGKMWGRQPGGHVFIPAMERARARMYTQMKAMLIRLGATRVTGDR